MTERSMDAMVASFPSQLRWTLGIEVPTIQSERMLVCGMGGSGIAADYAERIAGAYGRELSVHKDYAIPAWAYRARPLVVVASYSGNTEEALSAYMAAMEGGLPMIAVTTGGELARLADADEVPVVALDPGYQPRAAFGMSFGVVMRIAAAAGLLPDPSDDLEAASYLLASTLTDSDELVGELVDHCGSGPVGVITAEPFAPVAYRWKSQFNENANRYAGWSVVPELTHNELVPLECGDGPPVIALRSPSERSAIAQRFRLIEEMVPTPMFSVTAEGPDELTQMLYLTLIGDLVTVAVAKRAGVDPVAVTALETFKQKLRER